MAGQNDFRIFMHKGQAEGETPISSASPSNDLTTSPSPSKFGVASIALATGIGRKSFNNVVQQIEASGNEQLSQQVGNLAKGIGFGLMVAKAPVVALVTAGTSAVDGVSSVIDRSRQRKNIAFEIEQKGHQMTHHQMGSYYD